MRTPDTKSAARWPLRAALLAVAVILLGAQGACTPPPVQNEGAYDLQQIQGLWEARWADRLIRREITGAREVVSYYGADGLLQRSHIADFELSRSPDGRYQIFRWYNLKAIQGPPIPPDASAGQYLYGIEGDRFTEYHGATPELPESKDVIVWTRIEGGPPPAAEPLP